MIDKSKKNDFFAEVNWKQDDKATNECKVIKFTFPNGDECLVDRDHLNQMLFAIGTPEDQRKMIPQEIEMVHWRRTVLGIKATKDIHAGEMINFPIEISFPCTLAQEIVGEKHKGKVTHVSPSKIIVPKP